MDTPDSSEEQETHERFRQRVTDIRGQINGILESLASKTPSPADVAQLAELGGKLERVSQSYRDEISALIERKRLLAEEEAKRAMANKPSTPKRDAEQIQKLSQELTTGLRLERVDTSIKELLDFLGDTDFFNENVSVGRRRRLRALQTALEKALQK